MRTEYDLIVSLGGNCYVAKQLQHRGMRMFSLPLDWVAMEDERPISCLPQLFRERFTGFCLHENMVQTADPEMEGGHATYKFKDDSTGFIFVHHFHSPLSDRVGFDKSRAIIERRIDRMYKKVSEAGSVLFVLETSFAFGDKLLIDLYDALCKTFPTPLIDLYSMQFTAPESHDAILSSNVSKSVYTRHVAALNDVYGTSYEWSWLDDICIKGMPKAKEKRRSNLITQWKYKLWKSLGKSLYKEGAGCVGLTLP